MTKTIKSGDTLLSFTDTLTVNGSAVDLTNWTVKFLLKRDGETVHSADATITDAATGTVSYSPGAGFPTAPGTYRQEWEGTNAATKILTFPSDSYNSVIIIEDLN